jgi:LPS export ABC transporter protein LptC
MNVSVYFVLITAILAAIYIFFSPMKISMSDKKNVPQLQLSDFTIYDLNEKGLKSIFKGKSGLRYPNYYLVNDVNYTDASKNNLVNIKSEFGQFKDNAIELKGDVVYTREDGLVFKSDQASYNQATGIFQTNGKYISYKNNDKITGHKLIYNSKNKSATSKNIVALFQLNEK